MRHLDEKGWIFIGKDGNAYRCCMWGDSPWLFRWHDHNKCWVSIAPLTQMDVWMLPHNLTENRQEWYHKVEAETAARLAPKLIQGENDAT
jgi:hypothetical protein